MNNLVNKFSNYAKHARIMWFIYGIVFAHFGGHVWTYNKAGEVGSQVYARINPDPTIKDKAKDGAGKAVTVLTFGLVGDL